MTIKEPTILKDHITHASGRQKSVCVTAVMTALGIDESKFQYTGTVGDKVKCRILNRNGYSCRSRLSKLGGKYKHMTVGKARKRLAALNEDCFYMISVIYGGAGHLILLDSKGNTVVDTDPRINDKRKKFTDVMQSAKKNKKSVDMQN